MRSCVARSPSSSAAQSLYPQPVTEGSPHSTSVHTIPLLPGFCLPSLSKYSLEVGSSKRPSWIPPISCPDAVWFSPSLFYMLITSVIIRVFICLISVLHRGWRTTANGLNWAPGLFLKDSQEKDAFYSVGIGEGGRIGKQKYAMETTHGLQSLRYLFSGSLKKVFWSLVLPAANTQRAKSLSVFFTATSRKLYKVPDTS